MFDQAASLAAREIDAQVLLIVALCAVVLVGVTAAMIVFAVRFRRSRTPTTRQIAKNTPLEIAWTVIPTIIFLGMFFLGFKGFVTLRNPPPDAMEVDVLAQQWFWSFTYPDTGVTSAELWLPVDTPVKAHIASVLTDVIHSFYIPALRVKEDAVPGMDTFLWIQPDEIGTYNIFCAEFCGKDHSRMLSRLHVVSREDFRAWMDAQVAERYRPVDGAAALDPASPELKGYDGAALFQRYCVSCHNADGTGGGTYNARNFTKADGWKRSPKLTDIFTTIGTGIEGTQMRSFRNLPVRERLALMHRVASFLSVGTRPPVTPADVEAMKKAFPETDPTSPTARSRGTGAPAIPIEEAMKKVVEEGNRE